LRVLLLTGMPPCSNYTAGIVLHQLCSFLPPESVACFSAIDRSVRPEIPEDMAALAMKTVARPREHWNAIPGVLGDAASLAMEWVVASTSVKNIAQKATAFGREFGADRVWCVLEGQTLIRLALHVAKALRVPLYTQVWDPPGWWLRYNHVDSITSRRVLRRFESTIRQSAGCAAASWAMAETYAQRYGVQTAPVVPGLPAELAREPARAPHDRDEVVIGVAGQIYATREWEALLAALDGVAWQLDGRSVRIIVLGRYLNLRANASASIHYLGWRSQGETIGLLADADVLYCPYWFDPTFEEEARLSFPSKLTSYLAAGRPVFFHGPEYASPARFLRENQAAFLCHSLEPRQVVGQLAHILTDRDAYASATRHGRAAFDRYLTTTSMKASFYEFLGLGGALG